MKRNPLLAKPKYNPPFETTTHESRTARSNSRSGTRPAETSRSWQGSLHKLYVRVGGTEVAESIVKTRLLRVIDVGSNSDKIGNGILLKGIHYADGNSSVPFIGIVPAVYDQSTSFFRCGDLAPCHVSISDVDQVRHLFTIAFPHSMIVLSSCW